MGQDLVDQYTLLHFATGVIAYHWGVPIVYWFFAHGAFELAENTDAGMGVINKITLWPGGKDRADSVTNMVGDHLSALAGWFVASEIEKSSQD